MDNSIFWKDACKYGAILGLMMSLAAIIELSTALSGRFLLTGLTWLIFTAAYIVLLVRFTKLHRSHLHPDDGFPFGQAFGFLITMVLLCALITGVVKYLYIHAFVGYSVYIDHYTEMLSNLELPASMYGPMKDAIGQIQNAPTPSIVSEVWSNLLSNAIFCGILSLIIAATLVKPARPFASQQ